DLAGAHQIIKSVKYLLNRRQGVETVQLVEVDVVRAESLQARVHGPKQVMARRTHIVGAWPIAEGSLGGDDEPVAPPLDGLAKDLLGKTVGVNVRGVEHGQFGFEAKVNEPSGLADIAAAPRLEEFVAAPERARAEGQHGYLEPRPTKLPEFHCRSP